MSCSTGCTPSSISGRVAPPPSATYACGTVLNLENKKSLEAYRCGGEIHGLNAIPEICLRLHNRGIEELILRSLRQGDEVNLERFGSELGPSSKELFSPYPWMDRSRAWDVFTAAIGRSVEGIDLAYLVFHEGLPVAHFVLWGAKGQHKFRELTLRIPTLGLAVADRLHNRGIGRLCVQFLQEVAQQLQADALELTAAMQNCIAARLYAACDFQEIGTLRIPLGVDPSTSLVECKGIGTWREERHMVYTLATERAWVVRDYLLCKELEHAAIDRV